MSDKFLAACLSGTQDNVSRNVESLATEMTTYFSKIDCQMVKYFRLLECSHRNDSLKMRSGPR
jgi:hypothetical protein